MNKTLRKPTPSLSSALNNQDLAQISVAIIGVGNWGKNHLKVMQAVETVVEIRFLDPKIDSESLPTNTAAKLSKVSSLHDCLQRSNLAIIATPVESHFKIAEFFLTKRIPTFVEKPLAPTRDECRELFRIAERENVFLGVGFQYIFHPGILLVLEAIRITGDNAELSIYRSKRTKGIPRQDVDVIMDLAIHDIALAVHLSGSELTGLQVHSAQVGSSNLLEACTFSLHFASGFTAAIEADWGGPKQRIMELETCNHHWTIDEVNAPGVIREQRQAQCAFQSSEYRHGTSLVRQKDWLLNKARSGTYCSDTAAFNEKVMQAANAVQRTAISR